MGFSIWWHWECQMAHWWTSFLINLQIQIHNIFQVTHSSTVLLYSAFLTFFLVFVQWSVVEKRQTSKTNHLVTVLFMVCKGKKLSGDIVNSNFNRQFSHSPCLSLWKMFLQCILFILSHLVSLLCLFSSRISDRHVNWYCVCTCVCTCVCMCVCFACVNLLEFVTYISFKYA